MQKKMSIAAETHPSYDWIDVKTNGKESQMMVYLCTMRSAESQSLVNLQMIRFRLVFVRIEFFSSLSLSLSLYVWSVGSRVKKCEMKIISCSVGDFYANSWINPNRVNFWRIRCEGNGCRCWVVQWKIKNSVKFILQLQHQRIISYFT